MNIDEFLELEDKQLQKYIFFHYGLSDNLYSKKIDNEEKIGYYKICDTIKVSNTGTFYKKSELLQWMVYNKKTKKVKISKSRMDVFNDLCKEKYFKSDIELMKPFFRYPTPTFCKKIIEGKINSIRDILSYHRSYTLRNKNLSLDNIYIFMLAERVNLLPLIEDPESIESIKDLSEVNVDSRILALHEFKCKLQDVSKLQERYDKWNSEQSKKYDSLYGSRANNPWNQAIQIVDY